MERRLWVRRDKKMALDPQIRQGDRVVSIGHGDDEHEKKYYRHDIGHSLSSTCDIKPFKNRHGHFKNSDKG